MRRYCDERSQAFTTFLKNKKVKKGGHGAAMCGEILVTKRRDVRDVHVLSTVHNDELIDTDNGQQHSSRGGRHETKKTKTV